MPHYKLSEKRKYIKENHANMTVQEMALELNVTDDNVRYHLGVMDLERKTGRWERLNFTDEQKAFIEESAGVLTCKQMMIRLDCGYDRIVNYYRNNGLQFGQCKGALKKVDKEYIEANSHLRASELFEEIKKSNENITYANVNSYLKKVKKELESDKKIHFDVDFFKVNCPLLGPFYNYPSNVQFMR